MDVLHRMRNTGQSSDLAWMGALRVRTAAAIAPLERGVDVWHPGAYFGEAAQIKTQSRLDHFRTTTLLKTQSMLGHSCQCQHH